MTKFIAPANEPFALRNNEKFVFRGTEYPDLPGVQVLGIMRRSVSFPDENHMKTVNTPINMGVPVAMEAILACHKGVEGWVWVQLSPNTKEIVGSFVEDCGVPVDQWCYVSFAPYVEPETEPECTCHERDSSFVCQNCREQGYRGHMEAK